MNLQDANNSTISNSIQNLSQNNIKTEPNEEEKSVKLSDNIQ